VGDPDLAERLRTSPPVPVHSDLPVAQVFRTGAPVVMSKVHSDHVFRMYREDAAKDLLAIGGGSWSALIVPVEAGGEVVGVMSLLSPHWNGAPPREVRFAAEGLAGRAGMALHNARLYRAQVDQVAILSAALLPEALPTVRGMRFAVNYVPAWGGVCGDWYEAEELPDGRILVGVGDASGHGITAAAAMAQIRNAARGLAAAGMTPGQMLDHLSNLVLRGHADCMVTAVYGLVEPGGKSQWAGAGHPAPIVVPAAGEATVMALPMGPPIGVGGGTYEETCVELGPGTRVVLYTDGLFERRGEDPHVGIERLRAAAGDARHRSEETMADSVLACRPDTADDGCVLVIGVADEDDPETLVMETRSRS
ncbi:MAG: PP2C family protein-serine/threonine phosphatase, partial [Acidimicrobiales bacterium]